MKKIIYSLLLIGFISCQNPNNESAIRVYYPFDSLVDAQINYLTANNAQLVKSNQDNITAVKGLLLDSSQWKQELEIFQSLNINKATFVDAYEIGMYQDDRSNLDILSYRALDKNAAIREIKIYYFNSLNDIKRITATTDYNNTLYSHSKLLQMEFKKRNHTTALSTYSIVGDQKMALRDSLEVSIFGNIIYQ